MKTWIQHLLIAWGGTLGTPTQDVWTCTLKAIVHPAGLQTVDAFTLTDQQEWLTGAKSAFSAWMSSSNTAGGLPRGTCAALTWIKANMIGTDGKYMYSTTSQLDVTPAVTGGIQSANPRVSAVVTLETAIGRGRGSRGRYYPPAVGFQPDSVNSVFLSTSKVTGQLGIEKTFLNALKAVTVTSGRYIELANVSPGDSVKGTDPLWAGILKISMDNVADTQRRRTNAVLGTRQELSL